MTKTTSGGALDASTQQWCSGTWQNLKKDQTNDMMLKIKLEYLKY